MFRNDRRTEHWAIAIGGVLFGIVGCSGDGSRKAAPNDPPAGRGEAEQFAADHFTVVGAGPVLTNPEQDDSITIMPMGDEVVTFRPGDTLTVSIPFEAPNGNVVGAGIRFGDQGPIVTIPLDSFAGATSGTLVFDVQVPNGICDELGSICHDIRCYEFAVTDAGLVSAANLQSMASTCGDCTEPSCYGLLEGCDAPPVEVPADHCAAPEVEELHRSPETGAGIAVDDTFVYFGEGQNISRVAKDGTGASETLLPDVGVARYFLVSGDTLYFQEGLSLHSAPTAGGTATALASSVGYFVSDGESFFASSSSVVCLDSSDIKRIEVDGTETLLVEEGPCVRYLAVDGDYLYMLAEVAEDDYQVLRIGKTGGTPEPVGASGSYTGPLLASDSHIYFQQSDGLADSSMVRMAKGGGAIESFEMARQLASNAVLDVTGGFVFFSDLSYYGCLRRIDPAGNVIPVASNSWYDNALTLDETHVYALSLNEDLEGLVLRAAKP